METMKNAESNMTLPQPGTPKRKHKTLKKTAMPLMDALIENSNPLTALILKAAYHKIQKRHGMKVRKP